jgi:hypothetical protein
MMRGMVNSTTRRRGAPRSGGGVEQGRRFLRLLVSLLLCRGSRNLVGLRLGLGRRAATTHADAQTVLDENRRRWLGAVYVGPLPGRYISGAIMKAILSAALILGFCGLAGARDEKAERIMRLLCGNLHMPSER